jgi:hypothetical protein
MEQCQDCRRPGRTRYVAERMQFPSGITSTFGAVRKMLCDTCIENYEQPEAALRKEAAEGIVTVPKRRLLQRLFA